MRPREEACSPGCRCPWNLWTAYRARETGEDQGLGVSLLRLVRTFGSRISRLHRRLPIRNPGATAQFLLSMGDSESHTPMPSNSRSMQPTATLDSPLKHSTAPPLRTPPVPEIACTLDRRKPRRPGRRRLIKKILINIRLINIKLMGPQG